MKKIQFLISGIIMCLAQMAMAQQAFYDVTPGDNNGLRFWQDNAFKISMGNTSEFHYAGITSHSIKMNMDGTPGRGWTWGIIGNTPVAALTSTGDFQVAGKLTAMNQMGVVVPVSTVNTGSNAYGLSVSDNISSTMVIRSLGNGVMQLSSDYAGRKIVLGGGVFEQTLSVNAGGTVGIGTTSPAAPLHIKSAGGGTHLTIESNATGEGELTWMQGGAATANQRAALQLNASTGNFEGWTFDNTNWNKWLLVNRSNGFVGIGTSSPDQRLTVNGTIHSKEVKVDLSVPGPDYVFEKDYVLPSLESVKTYIDQNKHLPEVPSAKEMEANGINLSEMNMLLLKKVEELTLYVIELKKEIQELKK